MNRIRLPLALRPALVTVLAGAVTAVALTVPSAGSADRVSNRLFSPADTSTSADVSSNWSGYVATGIGSTSTTASSAMSYTDVTGQWTEPTASCTPGNSTSAALWVGLGGYSQSSQKLEQTGTSVDCDESGNASYYAWYELVPADSVTIKNLKIMPGDVVTSTVLINGNDVLVQVKDRTRKTSFTKHLKMDTPDLTSAEWIAEAPAECDQRGFCRELKLTNFGAVAFSHTFATGNTLGGTITSTSWSSTPIQLVPQSRRFFGDPNDPNSGSSGSGAAATGLAPDGSGFTVNWQANPSATG